MAGVVRGNGNTGKVVASWTRQLDDRLIWIWRTDRFNPSDQLLWWPGLERQITDFHARYERASLEE